MADQPTWAHSYYYYYYYYYYKVNILYGKDVTMSAYEKVKGNLSDHSV